LILFVLLVGFPPFEVAQSTCKGYRMVRDGHIRVMLSDWAAQGGDVPVLSAAAIDLLQCILKENPLERYSIEEIERHPWMQLQASPR
jgi:serine/threonine protein kinase